MNVQEHAELLKRHSQEIQDVRQLYEQQLARLASQVKEQPAFQAEHMEVVRQHYEGLIAELKQQMQTQREDAEGVLRRSAEAWEAQLAAACDAHGKDENAASLFSKNSVLQAQVCQLTAQLNAQSSERQCLERTIQERVVQLVEAESKHATQRADVEAQNRRLQAEVAGLRG